jgi:hypothetical protein
MSGWHIVASAASSPLIKCSSTKRKENQQSSLLQCFSAQHPGWFLWLAVSAGHKENREDQ